MDLMKIRIHFFKDMAKHTYFFDSPVYESDVAEKFLNSPSVATDRKLRNLAQRGLSRAYLMAALSGTWEAKVPSVSYLFTSLRLGIYSGRPFAFKDAPLFIVILYRSLARVFRKG
jgi:hypothetical protein